MVPTSATPLGDYEHPDPAALVSRQLSILDWAQQVMRRDFRYAMERANVSISQPDVKKLHDMSIALVRCIEALKKLSDLTDELAARMTPQQLLEAALKKVEGQDLPTVLYAIRRLRAHRAKMAAPVGDQTAAASIAAIDDSEAE